MRIKTTTIKVYTWEELTDEQKEEVLERYWDINVDYEWWDSIYDDAENVGIKITSFDLDRNRYCEGNFIAGAITTAETILENHGPSRETYKTAKNFLDSIPLEPSLDDDKYPEWEDTLEDLKDEFERSIMEDYAIMLQNEYEYLTSREAVIETIEANEYEFDEDGKIA